MYFFEDWEVWGSLQDNYCLLLVAPQAREIFEKAACIVDLLRVFRLDFYIILM